MRFLYAVVSLSLAASVGASEPLVVDRGPHHRTWETTREVPTPDGKTHAEIGSYVELQGGLHRWTEQGWVETNPRIEVFQDGAVARNLQYQATFAPNLATPGALDLLLPDGQRLQGHLLGLAYTEGNQSVLIAEVKDCAGVIGGAEQNAVTFSDAFTDVNISVQFVLQRDRISQNVIVHQQLPHPSEWGLTEDAVLEVLTEFTTVPAVRVENREAVDGVSAQHVSFESMEFVSGRAFSIGNEENATAVSKSWEIFEGQRTFVVEKIPWKAIAPELAKLPPVASDWKKKEGPLMARKQLRLPRREQARAAVKPIQVAQASAPKRGYLIDWELVSSTTYFLWTNSGTFYISGPISIKTNIFEGGVVIKYAPTNSASLSINGPVTCLSSNDAPIILTARDDHSVGEPIGSAPLSGMYANTALFLDNTSSGQIYELNGFRISHADTAIKFNFGNDHKLRNLQIVNCNYAISSHQAAFQVLNALFSRIHTHAVNPTHTSGTIGTLQNVTIRECNTLVPMYGTARVTNSLLIAVTNIVSNGSFSGAFNGTNSNPVNVFQPVGAGFSYLTNNSPFRNTGTTNIDSGLLASLKQLTTHPPIVVGPAATLGNTNLTLAPQALRDTNAPDLGYHYAPLDYAFGGVYVTNATITVQTGTAIAFYSPTNAGSSYGIRLGSGGRFFSDGSPTNLNKLVRYNMVQEQSTSAWNTTPAESISSDPSSVSVTPEARFTFTQWASPAADARHFHGRAGTDLAAPFSHCEFIGGKFQSDRPTVSITNCLFHRVDTTINGASTQFNPTFQNCLFYGGALKLTNSQAGTWRVHDSIFHGTAVSQSGPITHDYNGYITNAAGQWLTNGGSHDVFTNSLTWFTHALGRFYQFPLTFVNKGSMSANYPGLYHYTVIGNVKETNSVVDLGYHYIAVDFQNQPFDSDGDGTPDYLEDPDGDGLTDPGENSFANPALSLATLLTYTRGSPPKRINPAAIAHDIDTPNFAGAELTVWTIVFATENDRLGIHHEGTGALQIGVANDTISFGGVTIGTFSGGTADTPLIIHFNANASSAAVQALVRSITFHNVSSTDPIASRLLRYTLTDGTGGATTAFQTLNMICAQGIDVMLLIDISESLEPGEFLQAKAAASKFVSLLNFTTDRVGLISFAGYEYLNSALTTNGPAVQSMIMGLSQTEGTRFHPPLDLGRTNFAGTATNVMPLIVLLSDGRVGGANPPSTDEEKATNRVEAIKAATAVKTAGIRLVTIAYGTGGGLNDGTNLMRTFATSSGDYYYAPDAADIEARYVEIARGLCRGLTPPQIAIKRPVNPTELRSPATFRIETSTSDSDGFVKKVEFFNGSTSIGVSTNPPFFFARTNLAVGTNSFTAVATDDDNLSTTSSPPVVVTVANCVTNTLVSLTLTSSTNLSGLSAAGHVTISGPAPRGGQTVLLSCTNPYVSIPPTVRIAENTNTVAFRIDTRSVPNDLNATITAKLYGSTQSTSLTLLAANAHGVGVFGGQCGPMDVVFLRPFTSTLALSSHERVRDAISNAVNIIELASGGDYQLGLVSYTTNLHVQEQLALTNKQSFFANLYTITPDLNSMSPWDEALNTVVNNLPERQNQNGDFTNQFRAHARKIIVLLTHSYPVGFTGGQFTMETGIDDVNAHWRAVEAYLKGIEIAAFLVRDNPFSGRPETFEPLRDAALTTGGPFVWTEERDGIGLDISLVNAFSRCGADLGEVVFVRDDLRQSSYGAFSVNDDTTEMSARDTSMFDTTAIDGAITGARFRRSGQLRVNYGSRFDMQIGIRSVADTNLTSLGISLPMLHTNPVSKFYDSEWELPFSFYTDLHQQFGDSYLLELRDRVDGACGDNFEIVDAPTANFPRFRNTLTFKALRPLQIPQGRCRDFILTGTGMPSSGTWTITLYEQVIASSERPSGWSVEPDYTAYGGFNICVPTNAVVAKQYEVRYQDTGGHGSAFFEVLPAGTLPSAPVLKPLELSARLVPTNLALTVRVSLDAPAPPGGAIVSLLSTLTNAVPDSITIPAGQTEASFAIHLTKPVTSNTTHFVGAFYNGERQAAFTILRQVGAPAAPANVQVAPEVGRIRVSWNAVTNALFYRVTRATNGCFPTDFVTIADRLTVTNYFDEHVSNNVTYCYSIWAINSLGQTNSDCSAIPGPGYTCAIPLDGLLTPIITPPGGKFYDSVSVTISNTSPGATVYYTANGVAPTTSDPPYTTTNLVFTTNTVLKAAAYSGGQWSPLASRDFVIMQARPLSCGSNVVLTLSDTNWPSPIRGPNFNCERFRFVGGPGTNVTITVSAPEELSPHITLLNPAGQIVAQTTTYHPTRTELVYTCTTNGNHTIEVGSFHGLTRERKEFSISLDCIAYPKLKVVVDGAPVPNEGVVDMGITPTNTPLSKIITITNWGAMPLLVSNISVGTSSPFSVSAITNPIPPQSFTNLTVTFSSGVTGAFEGTLAFKHNDTEHAFSSPYVISLLARANPPGVPPRVGFEVPTNGQVFTTTANITMITTNTVTNTTTPLGSTFTRSTRREKR